ncbi:solute carrier family 2, facilitated glucose transporter member 11-like [Anolis sagrei]|uniref:solute carrier family 2, facilitated glucose transporter member 11-like n=1 Tax=Anolis sagrei TaxID=38937 RepID=UPI00352139BB
MEDLRSFTGLFQMLLVLGLGGNLLVGFQIAVVGFPSAFIKDFINETSSGPTAAPREQTLLFLWSLVVSIFGIGGLLGSLASGCLALRFGKKRTLLGNDLLVLLASFLLAFSQSAASLPMLLLGRFLFGVGAGNTESVVWFWDLRFASGSFLCV